MLLRYNVPWGEVVTGLHDAVKSVSSGHASIDVREASPPRRAADLVKVRRGWCVTTVVSRDDGATTVPCRCHDVPTSSRRVPSRA